MKLNTLFSFNLDTLLAGVCLHMDSVIIWDFDGVQVRAGLSIWINADAKRASIPNATQMDVKFIYWFWFDIHISIVFLVLTLCVFVCVRRIGVDDKTETKKGSSIEPQLFQSYYNARHDIQGKTIFTCKTRTSDVSNSNLILFFVHI